jgi:outer membrane receptor protein involved in Fe transport
MSNKYQSRVALFVALTLCGARAVMGQTATTDEDASKPQEQDQLGEIVVTAQRRSETLLKVAAPVTALQSDDLERQGDVRLADYAATVPGLNLISSVPGQTTVILRGISTGEGAAIAATTATYIDDSPFGTTTANALGSFSTLDLDPATLQRVEVLRGPQGTLYGASAMGGLIKYVTTPPSLDKFGGRVELTGSAIDGGGQGGRARAMFTGPVIPDKLGVTFNAFYRFDPGYVNNIFFGKNNVNSTSVDGGRVAILWKPIDKLSVDFSVLLQHLATGGTSNVDLNSDLTPIYGKYAQLRHGKENWDLANVHYALRANYEFGWGSLTSITSYQSQTATWNNELTNRFIDALNQIGPNLGVMDDINESNHKISQELRVASPDGEKIEWLGGFFFTNERSLQPENFQLISTLTGAALSYPGGIFVDPNHDHYKEYAGYADVTYHLTSQFKVLAGVRVTKDSEENTTPISGAFNGGDSLAQSTTASTTTTYLVSPSFTINDRNMVYARVATGFRPGGPTGLTTDSVAGAPLTYGPDTLTNYEIGYKASYPEQRMTLELSVFDIEWKSVQVLTQTNGFLVTGNGGNARSDGSEVAWTWRPIAGLSISANAAYTDAHLTADAPGLNAKAGESLPDVPKYTADISTGYDFPLTSELQGHLGASFRYLSSRRVDFISALPPGAERPLMPGYHTFDLHAGLSHEGINVEVHVKNVGNEYGFTRLLSELNSGYGPPYGAAVIQPRTFELSISDKF